VATTETSYTLTEAARVTGKSRVTMRRYLDAGRFPHAFQDTEAGTTPAPWRIPLGDLTAAGLEVAPADRIAGRPKTTQAESGGESAHYQQLREQLAVATALADERARTIDALMAVIGDLSGLLSITATAVAGAAPDPVGNDAD